MLNPLTNPDVHMLGSSWELIQAGHPVLELRQRAGERRRESRDQTGPKDEKSKFKIQRVQTKRAVSQHPIPNGKHS